VIFAETPVAALDLILNLSASPSPIADFELVEMTSRLQESNKIPHWEHRW